MNEWGKWFRDSFDKMLLAFLFLGLVALVHHMASHQMEAGTVAWAREQSGTVLGGLLGLITGALLHRGAGSPPSDAPKA